MSKAKIKKAHIQTVPKTDQLNWQGIALILLVSLLVFYPPYFQGLFLKQQMFVTYILTSLVFILVWADKWKRGEFSFIAGPLDWAVLGYAAAYALSLITAVVIGEAVYGFLRALNYFLIYWMITQVIKDFKNIRFILKTIIISALGVTLIGILAAAGLIDYPQAFFDDHIASTMGYHNTMATFLVVATLLGFSLLTVEKNRWWQLFYYIANYLMMLVVMAAVSKGAWLILVFGLVLMLIGVPREYGVRQIYFFTASMLPAIITSSYFMTAVSSASPPAAIGFVVVGILPVLAGWFLWRYIEPWLGNLKITRPAFIGLISMVLILFTLTISQVGLSDRITTEISEVTDTQNLSYVTRVDFMRWGTAIIKDYPITGAGAGGWEALYRQYQEYKFWTTETHSHIFQLGVEAGLIGVLAFISMWVIFFFLLYKLYLFHRGRGEQGEWVLIWGIASAAMGLGLHSSYDFDLSLPSMVILLWVLLALISVCHKHGGQEFRNRIDKPWLNVGISAVLVLTLLLSGSKYLLAFQQVQIGKEKMRASQVDNKTVQLESLEQAGNYFARAVKNDPRNAEYQSYVAIQQGTMYQIFMGQDDRQALVFREQSIIAANGALDLDPYDININQRLLPYLVIMGDTEGILKAGKYYILTTPNDPQAYQKIAELWWDVSQKLEANGQHEPALEFANEIIVLHFDLQRQMSRVKIDHHLWEGEKLKITPAVEKIYQEAQSFIAADPSI